MNETAHGDRIGRYRLIRKVGSGGMAEVWEGADEVLHRSVAIKLLWLQIAQDPELVNRFIREARTTAALDHPNILKVFDFGSTEGRPYLVTPLLTGGTLVSRLGQGYSEKTALNWLEALGSALDFAHSQGVIHRDVKPSNALFDGRGWLFLADFGISLNRSDAERLTRSGIVVGTPSFIAPEQILGSDATSKADQYALGVIAFQLIVGVNPREQLGTAMALHKTVAEDFPLASTCRRNLGPSVDAAFRRALARKPENRFDSCMDFIRDLETAMDSSQDFTAVTKPYRSPSIALTATTLPIPVAGSSEESPAWGDGRTEPARAKPAAAHGDALPPEPFDKILAAAEAGDPMAQLKAAKMLQNGAGVKKSLTEAARWFRRAADAGEDLARMALGECYEKGWGVRPALREAFRWYVLAGAGGLPEARAAALRVAAKGHSSWLLPLNSLAAREDATAQAALGICYENGATVPANRSEAVLWYSKATSGGNAYAAERLRELS